ncbi:MAG: hypothetical protein JNL70_09105 [Saprospiraceae bacterium]|nr:hypothetical protein [Saprospiraceae bacterium]
MKKLLIITVLALPTFAFGQDFKFHLPCSESKEAERDFKKGIRRLYIFGLAPDLQYCAALKKEGIEPVIQGCVVPSDLECYNNVMQRKIEGEKGIGFFNKLKLAK